MKRESIGTPHSLVNTKYLYLPNYSKHFSWVLRLSSEKVLGSFFPSAIFDYIGRRTSGESSASDGQGPRIHGLAPLPYE